MPILISRLLLTTCLLTLISIEPALAQSDDIEELVVTSQRRDQPRLLHPGNIERIDEQTLDDVKHRHIHELLTRIAGVWVSRGSGQEHLSAIRSPVLTGAGSCGAFLYLEDGIPTRPAGFCNVNALFEINAEQAESIEVIRGPGNALYGSNALHGIIHAVMPSPAGNREPSLSLELGANDFVRVAADFPFDAGAPWLASILFADDGGFRDDAGYRQSKLHAKRHWRASNGSFVLGLTVTDLDQETAGFILGEDAYRDDTINRSNPNPEAFRKARAQRLYGIWSRETADFDFDLRSYVRHTSMEFLQHFLPGQPLEENGHASVGAIGTIRFEGPQHLTIVGVDVEWSDLFLRETQQGPTPGSPFLMATRPEGKHYDYDVDSAGLAVYVQSDWSVGNRLSLGAGLRIEQLRYDYDNRMLDGNTRDDGTPCGFGGCLYTRPADRSDRFTNVAPKFSLRYGIDDDTVLYATLSRGFRAPQATELYRLQSGQQIADLDSEHADALEVGLRRSRAALDFDVALYAMRKRDSVYRDAAGFNVTGADSKHRGIEAAVDWQISRQVSLALDASYARHTYDFDVVAARGETFVSGRDIDTAPRWIGSLELHYQATDKLNFGVQIASLGKYYLDAENQFSYPGHTVTNLRAGLDASRRVQLLLRLNNATDRRMADRADFAFGNYRYFPGRGRELFFEIRYTPKESL